VGKPGARGPRRLRHPAVVEYQPITPEELAHTTVYLLCGGHWSGKQKVAKEDFPGAFLYEHPSKPAGPEGA
jgi:hypothetical protein